MSRPWLWFSICRFHRHLHLANNSCRHGRRMERSDVINRIVVCHHPQIRACDMPRRSLLLCSLPVCSLRKIILRVVWIVGSAAY